jgi:hypothetical protein
MVLQAWMLARDYPSASKELYGLKGQRVPSHPAE